MRKLRVYIKVSKRQTPSCSIENCTTCPKDEKVIVAIKRRARGGHLTFIEADCPMHRFIVEHLPPGAIYKLEAVPRKVRI